MKLRLLLVLVPVLALAKTLEAAEPKPFRFAHENVLGTSFELVVTTDSKDSAEAIEKQILKSIQSLSKTFSTYIPDSEISVINKTPFKEGEEIQISRTLYDLLREASTLKSRSGGAFSLQVGGMLRLWRRASKTGQQPTAEQLKQAAEKASKGFRVFRRRRTRFLSRQGPGELVLDAIAKGAIMDLATASLRRARLSYKALRLNVGGEILVLGEDAEVIGVSDPQQSEDNARPLTQVRLKNLAIATSGGYERSLKVGDKRFNHIIDPRSGRPAEGILSATVIAARVATADALATALCVLSPKDGLELVEKHSQAVCLIVDSKGKRHRSHGFRGFELARSPKVEGKQAWPAGFQVVLHFQLKNSTAGSSRRRRFKRHFMAAWVEDEHGRRVRLLALWAEKGELKYLKDLDEFWKYAWTLAGEGTSTRRARSMSRATRAPGRYRLLWDGLDDKGKAVPRGKYVLKIDVNREHGPPSGREIHSFAVLNLDCQDKSVTVTAKDQPELGSVKAVYSGSKMQKRRF